MIRGNKMRRVKMYILIDRCGEGYGWTKPEKDEEFWCIPYGWLSDNSYPFIEHRVNGKVTISINCDDISSIEFCDESEADHAIK